MKTKTTAIIIALNLFFTANVLSQSIRNSAYDLCYDFAAKQWSGNTFRGKYFIVPYKSQQRISVRNLPSNFSATAEGVMIEVTPEAATPETLEDTVARCRVIYISKVIEADEIEYTVYIKNDSGIVIEESVAFVKVFGGLKTDISTGVVFHSLANESYHLDETAADQFTLIKDGKKGSVFPISPVVLTHFHSRAKGFTTFGATLGLGINDDGKVGYYLGGALMLGDRQRAIISTGVAFRPVDVLKGKYHAGQVFDEANKPEIDDLLEDDFKTGFFFSISYNLTSKVDRKE